MSAVPQYESHLDFSTPGVRKDAFAVMERLVEHHRTTSTDMVAEQWHEPVRNYADPQMWEREVEAIHRRRPLPVALSCELPAAGTYKAITVVGTPLILTRDRDGAVHALVNACRHRGSEVVPPGTGTARRLTCPYHSWSYDLAGCLTGVYGEDTFGPVDRGAMGLRSLPVGERAGIVFVSLDREAEFDLDAWLDPELVELLEGLGLADCYHHSTRVLEGPNWKVVVDGYLEGYHFASLHRTTVFRTNLSNMAAFDAWGPHQRNAFALRPIAEAAKASPDSWDPRRCVGAIYWLFPGLAIAGGWREQVAVSFVFPGDTVDSSWTEQHILLRHEPADDEERKSADHTRDWFHDVVLDEDYNAGFGVQRGLAAMADEDFVFGRNEPGVQHFHRAVKEQLGVTSVGLCLPQLGEHVTRDGMRAFVESAEALGFGGLWVQEHVFYPHDPVSGYAGRPGLAVPQAYRTTLSALETLTAAAAWSSRVEIGTSVLVAGYHRPVQLAQRLATLDLLSGGRLVVGFSVGWSDDEHRQADVDPRTRGRRLDEMLDALDACWGPDPVRFEGAFFDIPMSDVRPKPARPPRLLSGMRSPAGLRRTAERFDIWNPASGTLDDILATAARLQDMRPAGKDPLDVYWRVYTEPPVPVRGLRSMTVDDLAQDVARARAAGIAEVVVDANFDPALDSPRAWAQLPARLEPLLDAAR